jgi:2-dehydropantoate 2-reductase
VETDGQLVLSSSAPRVLFGPLDGTGEPSDAERTLLDMPSGVFHWSNDALAAVRRKWLFNTVINSLCAVHRLPRNGDLLARREDLQSLFAEAFALGETVWGPWGTPSDTLYEHMLDLIEETAENENSMVRDLREGRRTESDALAGLALIRTGFDGLTRLHRTIVGE